MDKTYTFRTQLCLVWDDGETELNLNLVVRYEFTPGEPETGARPYGDPANYDPGSDDEVHITSIQIIAANGTAEHEVPGWLADIIRGDEGLRESLIAHAKESDEIARENAAEQRGRDALLEGRHV